MISQKPSLAGFLAVAALAAASTGAGFQTSRRRGRYDEAIARQKRLVEQRMTDEQQAWNAAVEAKRATKKMNRDPWWPDTDTEKKPIGPTDI